MPDNFLNWVKGEKKTEATREQLNQPLPNCQARSDWSINELLPYNLIQGGEVILLGTMSFRLGSSAHRKFATSTINDHSLELFQTNKQFSCHSPCHAALDFSKENQPWITRSIIGRRLRDKQVTR